MFASLFNKSGELLSNKELLLGRLGQGSKVISENGNWELPIQALGLADENN